MEGEILSLETAGKIARLEKENKQLKEKLEIYEVVTSSGFNKLSKHDQKEVINLIKYKNQYKDKLRGDKDE